MLVVCTIIVSLKDVIIVNHLVQFFETMQSEAEGSEPQKPGVAALAQGLSCCLGCLGRVARADSRRMVELREETGV